MKKFKDFKLIRKPLLVNEAGLMIYLYTNYLTAKNKDFFSFENSYPGFNYSQDLNLTSIDIAFNSNDTYIDYVKKIKKESLPYLEDFFNNQNEDILNLFYIFSENDGNYLPFFAGIFQNINVLDIKDFTFDLFELVFDLSFLRFVGVDINDSGLKSTNIKEWTAKALKSDFLSLIPTLPYEDNLSMELLRSFSNKKSIYNRLYPLLEKICEILANNFPMIEEIFADHFENIEKDDYKKVYDLINQVGLNDFLRKREEALNIYGLILAPNMTMIQFISEDYDDAFIKFGIYSSKEFVKKENKLKHLSQYLKILGDPTRIDILDLLKERNYYAKELSDKLYITPATLSYHISQLHVCGFIGAYIEGRKTYYYLRKPGFEKVIEELTEFSKDIKEEDYGKES
ncbi:winged helix-turn-helix domain-containing protein [Anaerococcus sp. NML200574]|uniref:ArsR/SmtB family transcription factor n=1 Tax=Anaerococcus sp. NML200574 TaxID=2954486 RepID=UPI0022379FA9|nr:winged helix-turn-helix domain-containing protein [Anaerococcus sp. NML200574]MCW6677657.1 winged helix-turn-helix domain-containing protein [Anaerococcus sp. NML200574]